jgi:peroxiredoxin
MSAFDPKQVRFIGVNQAEDKETVKTFLETRGWKFEVALDANQRVGQNFGVEGIPHTVVIGKDGKVAYVKSGYEPNGAKEVAEMVKKLMAK